MRALLVTAFYDIGRGDWEHLKRSSNEYVTSFQRYLALLPAPRYILAEESLRAQVKDAVDIFDAAAFSSLPSYRYLAPTKAVMESDAFQSLFPADARRSHIEQYIPEYNVAVMMKWEALERAARVSAGAFTHYVWADFGLGRRAQSRHYLPKPSGFSPIERDRIVISAELRWALDPADTNTLLRNITNFCDQVGTSIMIVPADKVGAFCALARRCYEDLLSMNLTSDDQVIVDMCVARRPDLFHLSFPPRGLSKFSHIHNILNGLDAVQPRTREIPIWDAATYKIARAVARWRIGL